MSIGHLVEYSTTVEYSDDPKISIFRKYDVWALKRTFSHVIISRTRWDNGNSFLTSKHVIW